MKQTRHPAILPGVIRGCSAWTEVQARLRDLPNKEKGDAFEELVKAYLQLEPEYASKLKHVWLQREVPPAVTQKLRLPVTDQGIDLVAATNEGEFWAIQCKYRQETDHSLTWRDISTFTGLTFGVCRGFSFGVICSTTERITHVLKNQERIGFCALDVWQGLDAGFFARLQAHLTHRPDVLKPAQPRPHQLAALKDGYAHFVTGKARRGKLIMPCGSGKSLTAYWLTKKLAARRIVVAVPSLALIRQTLRVWLREAMAHGQDVRWICVCSDESAGRIERDDLAVLRQDMGVPCLTASAEIAAWLQRKHAGLTIVFTTYQSGEALTRAARTARFRFDLGIMDEAHKTVGDGSKLFSHLLHDENLAIARRLFMTATERRYKGQSDTVLSMENPAIYGETFHLLSFKRALEYAPPILSDYKIISIAVSRDEVAELIRRNDFVKPDKGPWNEEIEADMLASLVALRKAMAKHPINHAVSFHGSIQRAGLFKAHNDAFSRAFPEYGKLETYHVSGKTPTVTRARIISDFAQSPRALITNARCLTEGVDVPGIDCVLFADPRRSAVDIVQAVGRALRPSPGKNHGYVIVPILHNAGATPDDIFESDSFQEILTTLRALAANDDRIIEYFRSVAQGRKRTAGGNIEFEMDERLAQRIDVAQFVQDIELKCWDRLAKLSWRPFEEARAFAQGLGLRNQKEWTRFCKGELGGTGTLPSDIPASPQKAYAGIGWTWMGDWLGTKVMATKLRQYRSFSEARVFVRSLGLKSGFEWAQFCKGKMAPKGKLPPDIPAGPARTYAGKGWVGMGDWLGTDFTATNLRNYRHFDEARRYARSLRLKNSTEWREFCIGNLPTRGKLPADLPANPHHVYSDSGWSSWGDWLGSNAVSRQGRKYRSFEKARAFVHELGLQGKSEWEQFCKGAMPGKGILPSDIPVAAPHIYATKGWAGWGDWLGTGSVASRFRQYRQFEDARAFVHNLKLKNNLEWREYCKGELPAKGALPPDVPACPNQIYKNKGWAGFGDWLGTGIVAPRLRQYRSFNDARSFVRSLGITSVVDWRNYCRGRLPEKGIRPLDIPVAANSVYSGSGWAGWGDWLGTGRVADQFKVYRPFREAREFVRGLKLISQSEWTEYIKGQRPDLGQLPADIPKTPRYVYAKQGWVGIGDWLGTDLSV